jgi:hypothetical protein
MTDAGAPMKRDTISRIESGKRRIYNDEAVLFSGVLEVPFVRLASPREGEDVVVRVDGWLHALHPIELRNWFVYGHSWTPAATAAQRGMRLAHDAYTVLRSKDEVQRTEARTRISEVIRL